MIARIRKKMCTIILALVCGFGLGRLFPAKPTEELVFKLPNDQDQVNDLLREGWRIRERKDFEAQGNVYHWIVVER